MIWKQEMQPESIPNGWGFFSIPYEIAFVY